MKDPSQPLPDADRDAVLDATIALLGLTVEASWRPEVLGHMKVVAEAAQLVLDFPLDDESEPAPVFRP